MKAHVAVDDTRNPVLSCSRSLCYQLLLKAKPQNPIVIKFFLQRGPNGDADLRPAVEEFQFSGDRLETPNYELPLTNPAGLQPPALAQGHQPAPCAVPVVTFLFRFTTYRLHILVKLVT
jgi:hypothetical protein